MRGKWLLGVFILMMCSGCVLLDALNGGTDIDLTDQTAPVPGNSGIIIAYDNYSNSVKLYWFPASDDKTSQGQLEYQLVYSFQDNISNLTESEANGQFLGNRWNTAKTNDTLINLTGGYTYYFNVIVRDESGKKSCYQRLAVTDGSILINYNPVAGDDGKISFYNLTSNFVTLYWAKAWDDNTPVTNLEYKIVYSLSNNISSLAQAENNGVLLSDWTEGKTNQSVNLNLQTTFYFNVIVRDEEGLAGIYDPISIMPSASGDNAPQPGYEGTIFTYDITTSSGDIYWYPALDDVTAESDLEYKVVYSMSNNISSVSDAQSNGNVLGTEWVANRTNMSLNLSSGTTFYFNILVRDGSGNITAYTTREFSTPLETSAPLPGNNGYISVVNLATTNVDLYWKAATDDTTPQNEIQYKLIYSLTDNIDTVSNAINNGLLLTDWSLNYTNAHVYGLTQSNTYYFNVIIKDTNGDVAVYDTKQVNLLTVDGFQYAGYTFQGTVDVTDSSSPKNNNNYPSMGITEPTSRGFTADGFFTLQGFNNYTDDSQYTLVKVVKDSTGETTSYWLRGDFTRKIWLRFGSGNYTVTVHYTEVTADLNYDGWISSWYYWPATYTFNVNNTSSVNGLYLFPSGFIQSDDSAISSIAQSLTSGLATQYDKIKACHDFVVTNLYYDDSSLENDKRKKQDALSALNNGTAVCEGYSTLFVALVRSLGYKAQYLTGYGETTYHAWSSISNASDWKLVDANWDDPGPNDNDPSNIRWDYFWKDSFSDHSGTEIHPERSGGDEDMKNVPEINPYYFIGYPYGQY